MDISCILVWNVRGLNGKSHRDTVRDLIAAIKPDIVCLQETKIQNMTMRITLSTLGTGLDQQVVLPASGTRGGILIAWSSAVCRAITYRIDTYSTSVLFQNNSGIQWWCTTVYGPNDDTQKVQFLDELRAVRAACVGPWMIAGDFNLIYRAEDKNNSNLDRAMMGHFKRAINDLELKEVDLLGRRFTWSNEREVPTLVRLDRVFCTSEWELAFPNHLLLSTAAGISDHCPLVLNLRGNGPGKRRFHFETFWPKLPGFVKTVMQAWNSVLDSASVCPLERLAAKFLATSRAVQSWSQRNVGNVTTRLEQAREILLRLQIAQERHTLTTEEDWLCRQLRQHTLALASLHRTIIRARSRIDWLSEGDSNTNFFHSHARFRKRKNFIAALQEGDHTATSHEDKQAMVWRYFSTLLGTAEHRNETLNLQTFHHRRYDLQSLDEPISEEETWGVIKNLKPDKAPGLDGFTGRFYRSCWQIIKRDIMAAIGAVHAGDARKLHKLNSAYMILIPKKEEAHTVANYRPISLVHSFAKLITKILANRLSSKLNEMVAANQSAFVKGQSIHDNFMMVQQLTRFFHVRRLPRTLLKLDITKAFDSVSWAFLLEVLGHLGFGRHWRNLLSNLLATSSTRVLLNGTPGDYINHRRGLRQGDPLSPMLFILIMDVLTSLIIRAEQLGLLQPLAAGTNTHGMSLYADDVALFTTTSIAELQLVKEILSKFGHATGLHTNMAKSSILPIRCEHVDELQQTMGCAIACFPCKYMGAPLSVRRLTAADLQPYIDRIADMLPKWKAHLMATSGRLVLVRAALTAIPIHLLIALDLPKWFLRAIDKCVASFFGVVTRISEVGTV